MKKSIIPVFLLSLIFFSSCKKINEDPRSFIAPETFYKTQADALAALTGAYDQLNMYPSLLRFTEWSSDNITAADGFPADFAIPFNFNAAAPLFATVWENSYIGINAANLVIGRVPGISMDETIQKNIIGEAKFLRALYYFNLVRAFGPVPLMTSETISLEGLNVPRSAENLVYDQIVTDLTEAEPMLPATIAASAAGRASVWAAKALLAKVYLTRASLDGSKKPTDYADAASKAQEVIASGPFDLWDDYAAAFTVANKNGKESIFSIQYKGSGATEGNSLMAGVLPRSTALGLGQNHFQPTADLVNLFEAGDRRRTGGFFSSYNMGGTLITFDGPRIRKYVDTSLLVPAPNSSNRTFSTDNNIYVLRFADVLLIAAEALNEANSAPPVEAYTYINRVRKRARFGNNAIVPDLSGLSQSAFRTAVLKERRMELFLEADRWFDLKRTRQLVPVMQALGISNVQERHYYFPIPLREIEANSALGQANQNEGY